MLAFGGFIRDGIYYIKGTSQSLSNALVEGLEEYRGILVLRHRVERIMVENGRAVGIRCRKVTKGNEGEAVELRAPVVVSNACLEETLRMVFDRQAIPSDYLRTAERMETATSACCLYVGLDCKFSELSGASQHTYTYLDGGREDHEKTFELQLNGTLKGFHALTDYTAMDPDLAPAGKSAVQAFRNEFMKGWDGLSDEDYQKKKSAMVEDMLAELEKHFPGFRSHIEVMDAATPRTMKRYTSNKDGSFNGYAYTPQRVGMGERGFKIRTPLKGLYLSSAWATGTGGGFYGSLLLGLVAAEKIANTADWKRRGPMRSCPDAAKND